MSAVAQPAPKVFAGDKAKAFHQSTLVWDCLSLYYLIDEPYAQQALEGGVNVANVTFGTEDEWETVLRNFELGLQKIEKSPLLALALTADDILKAKAAGKLAIVIGTQGSSFIEKELYRVELLYRLGLRICGLAYTGGTLHADGHADRGCGRDTTVDDIPPKINEAVGDRGREFRSAGAAITADHHRPRRQRGGERGGVAGGHVSAERAAHDAAQTRDAHDQRLVAGCCATHGADSIGPCRDRRLACRSGQAFFRRS